MRYTPKPWTRKEGERFHHDQSAGVRGPDGNYVACALDLNQTDLDEEVEGNALLISLAPNMLEALLWIACTDATKSPAEFIDQVQELAASIVGKMVEK